jgi:hypothetical protein
MFLPQVEHFATGDKNKLAIDPFSSYTIDDTSHLHPQRNLHFLSTINDAYISKVSSSNTFRGSGLTKNLEKQILKDAYNGVTLESPPHKDTCLSKSISLCEMTDPLMYIPQRSYPPKWLIKSLKDAPPPNYTNMSCFASNYACCKSSL